ncbi:MAG TPA: DNA starvation/stationary phase protection protein [Brumimicrobium sp.]|nr:DNA starvation/stationary phase protection protein [Brumimicrobium sp.]
MSFLNLDKNKVKETVDELNILLADYHLYYQKLRNFHWNIVGQNFFTLHAKFEEMYNDTLIKIDEVAERILTLRYRPLSNYSDYLKASHLKESASSLSDIEMVQELLSDHEKLIQQLRLTLEKATHAEDEGTADFITGYIAELEKTSWMLAAFVMDAEDNLPKS